MLKFITIGQIFGSFECIKKCKKTCRGVGVCNKIISQNVKLVAEISQQIAVILDLVLWAVRLPVSGIMWLLSKPV